MFPTKRFANCFKQIVFFEPILQLEASAWPRFSEWSHALVAKQLQRLAESAPGPSWHYLGLYLADDASMMAKNSALVAGKFLSGWWDTSSDAGPPRRPRAEFPEERPSLEVLAISNGTVKILSEIISIIYCNLFLLPSNGS